MADDMKQAAAVIATLSGDQATGGQRVKKRPNVPVVGASALAQRTSTAATTGTATDTANSSDTDKAAGHSPRSPKKAKTEAAGGVDMQQTAEKPDKFQTIDTLMSHMPSDSPDFKRMAGAGGNFSRAGVSERWTLEVMVDEDNLAMWTPNPRYSYLLDMTRKMVEEFGSDIVMDGLVHPFLGFASVQIDTEVRDIFAVRLMDKTQDPLKRFGQFLCSVGIKSVTVRNKDGVSTTSWTFDPERWNRTGYRITPGGDRKGGKPFVVFL
jgi:hypothetical protein